MSHSPEAIRVSPLHLRDRAEHRRLEILREEAFTPWVRGLPSRHAINAVSRFFRGFFLEARRPGGKVAGWLFSAPMRWRGDAAELPGYEEAHGLLYQELLPRLARGFDPEPWRGHDTLVLLTVLVDPEERGRRVPADLIRAAQGRAAREGWRRIISPFRPAGYGRHKEEGRRAHSEELFRDYCRLRDASGLPVDPWLRSLERNGMKMLRVEMRSVRRPRSRDYFEAFRRRFRPDRWYETAAGVWECGEVATWQLDPDGRRVWLIEPNVWGEIPVAPRE